MSSAKASKVVGKQAVQERYLNEILIPHVWHEARAYKKAGTAFTLQEDMMAAMGLEVLRISYTIGGISIAFTAMPILHNLQISVRLRTCGGFLNSLLRNGKLREKRN